MPNEVDNIIENMIKQHELRLRADRSFSQRRLDKAMTKPEMAYEQGYLKAVYHQTHPERFRKILDRVKEVWYAAYKKSKGI